MRILSTPPVGHGGNPLSLPQFCCISADMLPTCISISGRYLHVSSHARSRRFPVRAKAAAPPRKDSRRPESRRLPNPRVSIIRFARRQPSPKAAWLRRLPSRHRKHGRKRPRRRTTGDDAHDAHPSGHILINAPPSRRGPATAQIRHDPAQDRPQPLPAASPRREFQGTHPPPRGRTHRREPGWRPEGRQHDPPVTFACAPRGAADVPLHRKFRRLSSRKRSETGIARHGRGRPSGPAGRGNAARHRARRPVRPANGPESPPDPPTAPGPSLPSPPPYLASRSNRQQGQGSRCGRRKTCRIARARSSAGQASGLR